MPTFVQFLCINNFLSALDFECSDDCLLKSTSLANCKTPYRNKLCCSNPFKGESASGCPAFSPLKELEQHNNLFQYGALQVKSIWASSHLNIQS